MCDKVHGAGSAASAKAQLGELYLQGKGWDSSEGNNVGQRCENAVKGMVLISKIRSKLETATTGKLVYVCSTQDACLG